MYCRKLVFCLLPLHYCPSFFCSVATLFLARKFHEPLLQNETKISKQKRFCKNLLKVSEKKTQKNSGIFRLNKIMFKLLAVGKCLQLNCWQIQQLLAIVTLLWTCRAFSHFTFNISLEVLYYNYNWSKLKSVSGLTS